MSMGSKNKSQITAKNKVILTKIPTYIVPKNDDPISDIKPEHKTIVVIIMALPDDMNVRLNAIANGFPLESSILSLFKKCKYHLPQFQKQW
jgi:hypothetical protein